MQEKDSKFIVPLALAAAFLMFGCVLETVDNKGNIVSTNNSTDNSLNSTNMTDQLQITDLVIGTGEESKTGDTVSVHYVGTLLNGTKFDSSKDRGEPFEFTLGQNRVIQGWEQGVLGMKVGGTRKLVIPPSLGYGSADMGTIPPNSTLIFEVELLAIN